MLAQEFDQVAVFRGAPQYYYLKSGVSYCDTVFAEPDK